MYGDVVCAARDNPSWVVVSVVSAGMVWTGCWGLEARYPSLIFCCPFDVFVASVFKTKSLVLTVPLSYGILNSIA